MIVAVALGLALAIQAFLVKPYEIPSASMVPTLHINQRVLVDRIGTDFSSPKVGDIVVFHPPASETCANPARARTRPASSGRAPATRVQRASPRRRPTSSAWWGCPATGCRSPTAT